MNNFGFFTLKDKTWLDNQRYAGQVLSSALSLAKDNLKVGMSTSDIDDICEKYILDNNCIPTFKNYIGFPAATCVSVNDELVHGIPKKDVYVKHGDVVKIDCGATYKGAIADSAISVVVEDYIDSRHKELLEGCKKCLDEVISLIDKNVGKITLGDVGFFIKKEASRIGATAVKDLMGHGLELNKPHWFPQVTNYGNKKEGVVLIPNMTICIEPIFVFGSGNVYYKEDNFTLAANSVGVHWEHTVFLHENNVEIITKRQDEIN